MKNLPLLWWLLLIMTIPASQANETHCYDQHEQQIVCPTDKLTESDKYLKPMFQDNHDKTITELNTGLMWQRYESSRRYMWQEAFNFCEELVLVEYSDWTLPSKQALMSIVDYEYYYPSTNLQFFPQIKPESYWTDNNIKNQSNTEWVVDFSYGYINRHYKGDDYYVRCVRQP